MKTVFSIFFALFIALFAQAQHNIPETNDPTLFENPEVRAKYNGGDEILFKDLNKHITYSDASRTAGVGGLVLVTLIVEKDGTISNAKVIRGVNSEIDAEVLRAISKLQGWIPAQNKGEPVRSVIQIPFRFEKRN